MLNKFTVFYELPIWKTQINNHTWNINKNNTGKLHRYQKYCQDK